MCSMNGVVVLMCRCLDGILCCVSICFFVFLIDLMIVCVFCRNVCFFLVSLSWCVVWCSSVVFSFFLSCVSVWFVVDMVRLSCWVVVVIELVLIMVVKVWSLLRVVFIVDLKLK